MFNFYDFFLLIRDLISYFLIFLITAAIVLTVPIMLSFIIIVLLPNSYYFLEYAYFILVVAVSLHTSRIVVKKLKTNT